MDFILVHGIDIAGVFPASAVRFNKERILPHIQAVCGVCAMYTENHIRVVEKRHLFQYGIVLRDDFRKTIAFDQFIGT